MTVLMMYLYITDMVTQRARLEARRKRLMGRLVDIGPWVQGSLVSTARRCGKKNCACQRGGAKHPVLYLTGKEGGKTVSLYVPRAMEEEVRRWAANYRTVKALLKEIDEVSKALLRLREKP